MNPAAASVSNASPAVDKSDKSAQAHLYRLNPQPQQGYEVVLTIQDAPGPFEILHWSAGYQAKGCTYIVNDWAGVRGVPEHWVDLPFTKQSDGSYVATVYLDAMLDEDYYGNGVCEWKLTSVGAGGSPTGTTGEATFAGHIGVKSVLAEQPQAMFYRRTQYGSLAPKADGPDETVSPAAFGWQDPGKFSHGDQKDLFSFVLTPRKIQP